MISIRAVCKVFGRARVLDRLSLEVGGSQRMAVMGPSGCGKTTLLRLVAGLDLPDAGEVWINGGLTSRPGWALAPHQRGIGMVFQSPALFPHLSVAQNIAFGCAGLSRQAVNERLRFLRERLMLDGLAQRYPHQLSGGEARRVGLARALAVNPHILLLDEALTNLNRELKKQILGFLREYLDTNHPTCILVTHDPTEAEALAADTFPLGCEEES